VSPFVLAVVAAAAVDDGSIAIALDDGTVWRVGDGEWEEIGACPDGEVAELVADATTAELAVTCGDGSAWRWSESDGWTPVDTWNDRGADGEGVGASVGGALDASSGDALDAPTGGELAVPLRSWWPQLEVITRATREEDAAPVYEGWVRLRWDL
jgi:hypothetical protein